jgi:hypothetical protein
MPPGVGLRQTVADGEVRLIGFQRLRQIALIHQHVADAVVGDRQVALPAGELIERHLLRVTLSANEVKVHLRAAVAGSDPAIGNDDPIVAGNAEATIAIPWTVSTATLVDRSEASMNQFYAWLGEGKSSRLRLAVMDMLEAVPSGRRCRFTRAAVIEPNPQTNPDIFVIIRIARNRPS